MESPRPLTEEDGEVFDLADDDENPEWTDEMDEQPWSEDVYATDEEREMARQRFTDNSGWVVVVPAPEEAEPKHLVHDAEPGPTEQPAA
jgi:hypothetical protein